MTTSDKENDATIPMGTAIRKQFDGEWYEGVIDAYEAPWYHVTYSDGDHEDLTFTEVQKLVLKRKSAGQEQEIVHPPKRTKVSEVAPQETNGRSRRAKAKVISYNEDHFIDMDDDEDEEKEKKYQPKKKKLVLEDEEELSDVDELSSAGSEELDVDSLDVDSLQDSDDDDDEDIVTPITKKDSKSAQPVIKKDVKKPITIKAKPARKAAPRKSTASKTKDPNEHSVSDSTNRILKSPYTAGDGLPPLSEPQDMFDDMMARLSTEVDLTCLHNKELRVATMCSGTESPLLAADMISNALLQHHSVRLNWTHVFSCEIEPFKQAYIERNFQPPLLFRDIRELGSEQATTAYGALRDVPLDVDVLIAGTSCVDYSNLNNSKKELDELGESGQTFHGMVNWIRRAKPQIILLENVSGAPWDQKVRLLSEIGYAATFTRIDTKQYYIPQTRQRGYLFAIRSSKKQNDPHLAEWMDLVKSLKRPASASLDKFMLPNDDPRVLRGRAKLTAESLNASGENRAGRTDWTKCETRHQRCRSTEQLGDQRPLTEWSETTAVTMPGFAWNDWTGAQVNRIHDLMDINTLRMAQLDMDCTYKTMVWNVSQNVDRDTMGRLGLCQCLTPDGVFYVSNRGGPLVGEELLLLQGIPVDDLLLTKESEDNLKDLAGNAMSSTVVGACLLSALIAGQEGLGRTSVTKDKAPLVPRPLMTPTPESITQRFGTYETVSVPLKPLHIAFEWAEFIDQARSSARLCVSEGSEQSIPFASPELLDQEHLLRCRDCGHSCSSKASRGKYEEHSFEPWVNDTPRTPPYLFMQKLKQTLPMTLTLAGMDLDNTLPVDDEWTNIWKQTVKEEFRLSKISRSVQWHAIFTSSAGARLELNLGKKPLWLLFSTGSQHPLARMYATQSTLIDGAWQVCLPQEIPLELQIRGHPCKTVESWRQRMGLQGKFLSEVQYDCVEISVLSENNLGIDGIYQALPKCGGACGSMHKRSRNNSDSDDELFFFLESGRRSLPNEDYFVIAPTCHRTCDGEYRETLIRLDPSYRSTFFQDVDHNSICLNVPAHSQDWRNLPGSAIVLCSEEIAVTTPTCLRVPRGDWMLCPELIDCRIPSSMIPVLNKTAQVNLNKSQRLLQQLAFCLFRLEAPPMLNDWLTVISEPSNNLDSACTVCAPRLPSIKWRRVQSGKTIKFEALEDGKEGAAYERALKHRPQPWLLRLIQDDARQISVKIGCNPVSLVEQALGCLPVDSLLRLQLLQRQPENIHYDWRVVQHVEQSFGNFSKLRMKSNKLDASADQPPNFHVKLRPEQLRSLKWMLEQETGSKIFYEEEVVEAILPTLPWRAEGRVRRPVAIRGGIIADEVGYGKTAITLGLVDSTGEPPAPPAEYRNGFLALKATLVVVPSTLTGQWPSEIRKFLGTSKKVVTIKDMAAFNNLTVSDLQAADIVIIGFNVLSGEKYFNRLARFCGVNPGSLPKGNTGGRRFAAIYKQCLLALRQRVEQLKTDCSIVFSEICKAADQPLASEDMVVTLDKKKTAYKAHDGKKLNETVYKIEKSERDPWELSKVKSSYNRMKSPPLEMFFWNRIVVDEFSYLDKKDRNRTLTLVQELKASYRWCLSGTPPHANFNDVRALATLLGVHLGIEEYLPGTKITKSSRKENTGLESLSQFLEVRTMQWHERRHVLAQAFLDSFVRQNIAEIDEIPYQEHILSVDLAAAERAIYLELETHLKSLEMDNKRAKKSKKSSVGDRDSRMQLAIVNAESAEEALLKCCCHYNLSSGLKTTNAKETMVDIIRLRQNEKSQLEKQIMEAFQAARRQQQRILELQPDWADVKKTENGDIHDALEEYLRLIEQGLGVVHGADEEVNNLLLSIARASAKNFGSSNYDEHDEGLFQEIDGSDDEGLFVMKLGLRNYMHRVRAMAKGLCGRSRSLRFVECIANFRKQSNDLNCSCCGKQLLGIEHMGVLSCCGHSACLDCLKRESSKSKCIDNTCKAQGITVAHVVSSQNLGLDSEDSVGEFGSKLSHLVQKTKDIISLGDKLIIFCQFDDLKATVSETLKASGIRSLEVKGTAEKMVETVSVFQKEKPSKNDPQVLILKMDDEQSAGLNLTNLNHAIFVHPLLAESQQNYDAYETQAIGRIRRYGQNKTVNIWRFLAKNTIDEEIFADRTKKNKL